MENATKALLIAAAVLIVILLIAFGMKIFNSTSNVSGQATSTGKALGNQAAAAANSALSDLSGWGGTSTTKTPTKTPTETEQ